MKLPVGPIVWWAVGIVFGCCLLLKRRRTEEQRNVLVEESGCGLAQLLPMTKMPRATKALSEVRRRESQKARLPPSEQIQATHQDGTGTFDIACANVSSCTFHVIPLRISPWRIAQSQCSCVWACSERSSASSKFCFRRRCYLYSGRRITCIGRKRWRDANKRIIVDCGSIWNGRTRDDAIVCSLQYYTWFVSNSKPYSQVHWCTLLLPFAWSRPYPLVVLRVL
jgi:hypothetical protein